MTFTKLSLTLGALVATTPALAHPGHAPAGHVHWEFVAAGLAFVAACGVFFWRRQKAVQETK